MEKYGRVTWESIKYPRRSFGNPFFKDNDLLGTSQYWEYIASWGAEDEEKEAIGASST